MRESVLLISFIIFFIQACSTANIKETGHNESVQINTGDSYEECIELVPGQIMSYSFSSSDYVDFNIHYHSDKSILYPINKRKITAWEGSLRTEDLDFYSKDQEYFCLMWDNHNSNPVDITFNYHVDTT